MVRFGEILLSRAWSQHFDCFPDMERTVAQYKYAICEPNRLLKIVRYEHHCAFGIGPEMLDQPIHLIFQVHIERGERLIEKQQAGAPYQAAS